MDQEWPTPKPDFTNSWAIDQAQKSVDNLARYLAPETKAVLQRVIDLARSSEQLRKAIEELK